MIFIVCFSGFIICLYLVISGVYWIEISNNGILVVNCFLLSIDINSLVVDEFNIRFILSFYFFFYI